jgi:hypothetical protein
MLKIKDTSLAPAYITLKTVVGLVEHKIYGYALYNAEEDMITLYHSDLRRKPAMKIHRKDILSIVADYI